MTWQDPYGQYGQNPYDQPDWQQSTQPAWQDPYGQQNTYGGQQPYYGPPGVPTASSNGAAVGALVTNIILALVCCAGIAWLPGIILSAVAMSRNQTDPESARNLTMWAWACAAIDVVLAVVLLVVLYSIGTFTSTTNAMP